MSTDWTASDEAQRWLAHVERDMVPKMQGSSAVVSIVPRGEGDLKFAVELGVAVMLDKPIILAVQPGRQIPDNLRRVADAIVEMGEDQASFGARLQVEMERVLREREWGGRQDGVQESS